MSPTHEVEHMYNPCQGDQSEFLNEKLQLIGLFLFSYWLDFYFQVGEPIIKEGVCQNSGSGGHVQSMSGGPIRIPG